MRFPQIAFSTLLLGSAAVATQLNERFSDGLDPLTKRQQFVPTTTTAQGETCADAFGGGYVTCTLLPTFSRSYVQTVVSRHNVGLFSWHGNIHHLFRLIPLANMISNRP
jgi:hypothetical protein